MRGGRVKRRMRRVRNREEVAGGVQERVKEDMECHERVPYKITQLVLGGTRPRGTCRASDGSW